jgi:hypothetical protein
MIIEVTSGVVPLSSVIPARPGESATFYGKVQYSSTCGIITSSWSGFHNMP